MSENLNKLLEIVTIDRHEPFCYWWVDPSDRGVWDRQQDERSYKLTKVNLSKIRLEHYHEMREEEISGEEKLKRAIKKGDLLLDCKIWQELFLDGSDGTVWTALFHGDRPKKKPWEKYKIPDKWKRSVVPSETETTIILFPGSTFHLNGRACVIYAFWEKGENTWKSGVTRLAQPMKKSCVFAVLEG